MVEQFMQDISPALARQAFAGVSFDPEKRGETVRYEYAKSLLQDYTYFQEQAQAGGTTDSVDAEFSTYREGCKKRFCAYLSSNSRTLSAFIAGPANFPARRMNKRADVAQKRLQEYVEYRQRARTAIIRTLRPDLAPILSSDSDATTKLRVKIQKAKEMQALMKAANAAIRKHKTEGEAAQVEALGALGLSERVAKEVLKPDFCGRIGFADYELTNNNANIKRMEARLSQVTEQQATEWTQVKSENGITLEDDPPANRVRLIFPGKPDEETRNKLKSRGFRWSPTSGAWQAYRNPNALAFADAFVKGE